ncbi:MAG: HEAT repeat domain-containing protein [Verrucomicrobiota bacterium]
MRTVILLLICFTVGSEAEITPEFVLKIHAIYEKIPKESLVPATPSAGNPPAPTKSTLPNTQSVEELTKLLSESENPRRLVGTSALITNPVLEKTGFFDPSEKDTDEVKQELAYLVQLKNFLAQTSSNYDPAPFLKECKQSGPYWIDDLFAQQTSEEIRLTTLETFSSSPSLLAALLTSPQSQNDPVTIRLWAKQLPSKDAFPTAMLLILANAHPDLEAEALKPVLPEKSTVYPQLLSGSPALVTDDDLQTALFSLASPNIKRRANTAAILAKTPAADSICHVLIDSSPELRTVIFNHYPLATLKEMNTPYSLAAYYRRMGVEAATLPEKIKNFTASAQTGVDGKECLKTILSLPQGTAIIEGLPPTAAALGTLLQDLKEIDPAQLQIFMTILQKQVEKAQKGNWDSLGLLLTAARSPQLQETLLPMLTTLYPAEIAADILRITQGKMNEVTEEARQGNASALESLHVMTQDAQIPMRQSVYETLGLLANVDPKARELVITMAKDKNPSVRQFTVIGLGSKALRKKELLTVLLEAAQDPDATVRESAANSLIVSVLRNNPDATQALANLAENDPVDSVKKAAIQGLANGSTGGNTKTIEILKKLSTHSNPVIAQTAKSVLPK